MKDKGRPKRPGTVIKVRLSDQALQYVLLIQKEYRFSARSDAAGSIIEAAARQVRQRAA